ncbi:hypothetical protein BD410DRAFT_893568 [Rickenella mellea]|uniref:Protein byr4 n=1 Tax=Rickenella mellea TaxID=50990 RepID=A0A4Y7QND7_9AGAM|nr:hypothetical protein BD410DRAFT_893568 [Rickenella mellea]
MNTVPAPTFVLHREEWPDADFELPDGDLFPPTSHGESDKDDEEDWDLEMDLGRTGGAKPPPPLQSNIALSNSAPRGIINIRPPPPTTDDSSSPSPDADDDDEGISTIKVSALPNFPSKSGPVKQSVDDDLEAAFDFPSDLTKLSLRPLSLNHRSSKNSLGEWGDHTSSSTSSSDAYSSLGFGVEVSSSNSTTSASLPGTDDDCDEDEDGELDGLVIPTGLFESDQGRKHLTKILEMKKKLPRVPEDVKVVTPDPDDDFEVGLVIDDGVDFSPSRLIQTVQLQARRLGTLTSRSKSAPTRSTATNRPPSRLRNERPKTPLNPPSSFLQQPTNRGPAASPSPAVRPPIPSRSQTAQVFPTTPAASSSTLLPHKSASLRGQKSHSGLKTPSPPSSAQRKLSRKASLSSLIEASHSQTPNSGTGSLDIPARGYFAPTAASRARTHLNSTSRLHALEPILPPSRPSTPSSNPAALRLTMPTSLRTKSRTPISSIFPTTSNSPPPTRSPPRTIGFSNSAQSSTSTIVPKLLRRTKRRTYGDGTELDGIEDLPTDRDKEARFRVQPKVIQNRVPGGSYPKVEKDSNKGTIRRKRELSGDAKDVAAHPSMAFLSLGRRQQRVDPSSKSEISVKKKRSPGTPPVGQTKRKPTLIRNLGGVGAPKVVGEMKWNPQTLRWEGNDHVLRDFDAAVGTSTRPALITHLTGSSIGSPVGTFGSAARMVGNMIFDPVRMCWMSTLPPEDDEPDIFADMADDEDDDRWETKGGTIRASQQHVPKTTSDTSGSTSSISNSDQARHRRSMSESGSDRGSRASMVCDVDDQFFEICRKVEVRHRVEMKGWTMGHSDSRAEPSRSSLYDIRALATRQY